MTNRTPDGRRETFETQGFLPPERLFSRAECRSILARLQRPGAPAAVDWPKGHAASQRAFLDVAVHGPLLDRVSELLGPDVMLWGAMLATQPPGGHHPWHSDIESVAAGPNVGVWIGLDGVRRGSALRLVSRTHHLDPVQQLSAKHGVRRRDLTGDRLLAWARELDPACELLEPEIGDGEVLVFDGRLWHGSFNRNRFRTRQALLLQYATPASPVRIPEPERLAWPFRFVSTPRPATIMVRGSDASGENRIVPGPPAEGGRAQPALGTRIQSLGLPLAEDRETGWRAQPIFSGATPNVPRLSCHVSTLSAGATPHPIHGHEEEEVLVMLAGEMDLVIERDGRAVPHRVRPGQFVYYPAWQRHTIHNASDAPASYVILKWWAPERGRTSRLAAGVRSCRFADAPARDDETERPFRTRGVFADATGYLAMLGCHVSRVEPGGGYAPHADAHDVALVPLDGRFEAGGQTIGPGDVAFFAAGERHGLRGVGDGPAEYLVFELHGRGRPVSLGWLGRIESRLGPWPQIPKRVARALWRRLKHASGTDGARL